MRCLVLLIIVTFSWQRSIPFVRVWVRRCDAKGDRPGVRDQGNPCTACGPSAGCTCGRIGPLGLSFPRRKNVYRGPEGQPLHPGLMPNSPSGPTSITRMEHVRPAPPCLTARLWKSLGPRVEEGFVVGFVFLLGSALAWLCALRGSLPRPPNSRVSPLEPASCHAHGAHVNRSAGVCLWDARRCMGGVDGGVALLRYQLCLHCV